MKKYFAICALLGVFAFASVSFLAQAQNEAGVSAEPAQAVAADPSDGEADADIDADPTARTAPKPAKQEQFGTDDDACKDETKEMEGPNGSDPKPADVERAYKKCMGKKGYMEGELRQLRDYQRKHEQVDEATPDAETSTMDVGGEE